MNEYGNEGTKKFVAEYYTESGEKMGFFNAKSEEEVKNYLIKKYGESVEIINILELNTKKEVIKK